MPTHHFHLGSKDLDSGSLAYVVSTLTSELSPQPQVSLVLTKEKQMQMPPALPHVWAVFMHLGCYVFV